MTVLRIIHAGQTAHDLQGMLAFFAQCLGAQAGDVRQILGGDSPGHITGVAGLQARVAMLTLPDGHAIELLEYRAPGGATQIAPPPCGTGAAHLALAADSVSATALAAQGLGFAVAGEVLALPGGPFAGQHVACIRDERGFTLALIGGT